MSLMKSRCIIDDEALVGKNVGFFFSVEGLNIGKRYLFIFQLFRVKFCNFLSA